MAKWRFLFVLTQMGFKELSSQKKLSHFSSLIRIVFKYSDRSKIYNSTPVNPP